MNDLEKAARMALEALEYYQIAGLATTRVVDSINALRQALSNSVEQPAQQQEPVLWLVNGVVQTSEIPKDYTGCLFTSPQSKPWVGLTQQDIDIAFDDTQEGGGFDEFARAIEAKLREKNA